VRRAAGLSPPAKRLAVEIGGARLLVETSDPSLELAVAGATRLFLCDEDRPDVRISVARRSLQGETLGRRLFNSGGLWQLHEAGEGDGAGYLFQFHSAALGPGPYKQARFDRTFSTGEIVLSSEHPRTFARGGAVLPLEYPLDELLMVHWLAGGHGIEVHGCGLTDAAGTGHLFVGHSGAGKTTMGKLWRRRSGVRILSDDRIIVRREGDQFFMYGTPWHGQGKLSEQGRARLAGIYLLHHGREHQLSPKGGADAASHLMSRCFVPFHDAAGLAFTVEFVQRLVTAVPCADLWFRPRGDVVDFLQNAAAAPA
jgi:hypothetical protein